MFYSLLWQAAVCPGLGLAQVALVPSILGEEKSGATSAGLNARRISCSVIN